MHGCYLSPAGRSKLVHHSVCTVRPIIVRLMNYYHATVAIILLSLSDLPEPKSGATLQSTNYFVCMPGPVNT